MCRWFLVRKVKWEPSQLLWQKKKKCFCFCHWVGVCPSFVHPCYVKAVGATSCLTWLTLLFLSIVLCTKVNIYSEMDPSFWESIHVLCSGDDDVGKKKSRTDREKDAIANGCVWRMSCRANLWSDSQFCHHGKRGVCSVFHRHHLVFNQNWRYEHVQWNGAFVLESTSSSHFLLNLKFPWCAS